VARERLGVDRMKESAMRQPDDGEDQLRFTRYDGGRSRPSPGGFLADLRIQSFALSYRKLWIDRGSGKGVS
jgi:hypothetical protein